MATLRQILKSRGGWLAWACALALAARILVPAGYMPATIDGTPTIAICDGTGAQMAAMPGMGGKHGDHDRQSSSSCPFAIAAMAGLGGVDAIALIATVPAPFIVGASEGRASARLRMARLRPPAQGPPAA